MKKILLMFVVLVAIASCTYEKGTQFVQNTNGEVYRIEPDKRCNECYNVIKVDSTIYSKLFK